VKESVKTKTYSIHGTHEMVRLENKIRIKKWKRKSIQEGTRNSKEKQMKHRIENYKHQ
jgi:hypothetical protein